ncbi:hypothetical protein [Sphingomonas sp. IC081]|uniref:hypothetical protein n=1 Tax=Sphingomonas sp. IC081 TaxID=304378 RepID=UPI0011577C07|nr:hypothetical protein [Sphingomonas sp. IC081]
MPFTDEERAAWLAAKRAGVEHEFDVEVDTAADFEHHPDVSGDDFSLPLVCLHCGCPFSFDEGSVGEEAAICDSCNGD